MDFETRMRKLIKDLVFPVIDKAEKDRASMLILKSKSKSYKQRITTLEQCLLKTQLQKRISNNSKMKEGNGISSSMSEKNKE